MQYGNIEPRIDPSHPFTQAMPAPNETGKRFYRQDDCKTLDSEAHPNWSIPPQYRPQLPHLIPDAIQPSLQHLHHGLPDSFGGICSSR